jgi:hypothetical protein
MDFFLGNDEFSVWVPIWNGSDQSTITAQLLVGDADTLATANQVRLYNVLNTYITPYMYSQSGEATHTLATANQVRRSVHYTLATTNQVMQSLLYITSWLQPVRWGQTILKNSTFNVAITVIYFQCCLISADTVKLLFTLFAPFRDVKWTGSDK